MSVFVQDPTVVEIRGEKVLFTDPPFRELVKKCLPALQRLLPYLQDGTPIDSTTMLRLAATDDAIDSLFAFFSACSKKPIEFFDDLPTQDIVSCAEALLAAVNFSRLKTAFSGLMSRVPTTPR